MFLYVFLLTIVLTSPYFPRSLAQNSTNSNEFKNSNAVVTVSRGIGTSPDTFSICSKYAEPLARYFKQTEVLKTMNCTAITPVECHKKPELKARYYCKCNAKTTTYVEGKRGCVNNGWLRQGCAFRFGSWDYQNGWMWLNRDDFLLSLYFDPGLAITGSFNVTTTDYTSCNVINVTMLNRNGKWELFSHDKYTVRLHTFRQMFKISWETSYITSETKAKLSGQLFRFYISCDSIVFGDIIRQPIVSCLVFRATGNATFVYEKLPIPDTKTDTNTTAIVLGVVFALLLLIVGVVLGIYIFRRRRDGGKPCLPKPFWKT